MPLNPHCPHRYLTSSWFDCLCNIRFLYWVALKLHWSKLYLLPSWLFNWCILRSLLSANLSLQKFNLVCLDLLPVPTGRCCWCKHSPLQTFSIVLWKYFHSNIPWFPSHPSVHHADCPRCQVVNTWHPISRVVGRLEVFSIKVLTMLNMITSSNSTGKDRSPFHKEAVQE